MNVDSVELNKSTLSLNSAITELENARKLLKELIEMEIPSGFTNYNYLESIPGKIELVNIKLTEISTWVGSAAQRFQNAEDLNMKLINNNPDILSFERGNTNNTVGDKSKQNANVEQVNISKDISFLKESEKKDLENNKALRDALEKSFKESAKKTIEEIGKSKNPLIKKLLAEQWKEEDSDYTTIIGCEITIELLGEKLKKLSIYFPEDADIPDLFYKKYDSAHPTSTFHDGGDPSAVFSDLGWTEEEWNAMIDYMKKNNLTWHDIIKEYNNAIEQITNFKNKDLTDYLERKYQMDRFIEIYPYTLISERDSFKEYLKRDYSHAKYSDSIKEWNDLTQEEKATYVYLLENYSEEEAKKYLESLKDSINQRKGAQQAYDVIKSLNIDDLSKIKTAEDLQRILGADFLKLLGVGFKDGVCQFGENIGNLWPGNGEIRSELQYKQAFLQMMLSQEINLEDVKKQYGENSEEYKLSEKLSKLSVVFRKIFGNTYNIASSIGNAAIPMAVSAIPKVGPLLGAVLSGLSSAGAAKATAYQSGITGGWAYLYAALQGISSALLDRYMRGIPFLSKNAATSGTLLSILRSSVEGGLSGVIQNKIDLCLIKAFKGEIINLDELFDLEQDAQAFLCGFSTAFILNGGKTIAVKIKGKIIQLTAKKLEKMYDRFDIFWELMKGDPEDAISLFEQMLSEENDNIAPVNHLTETDIDINSLNNQQKQKINELINVFKEGKQSDATVIDYISKRFAYLIKDGDNPSAELNLQKLIELKKCHPEFYLTKDKSNYFNFEELYIALNDESMVSVKSGTFNHESEHGFFKVIENRELPSNWENVMSKTKNILKGKMEEIKNNFSDACRIKMKKAKEQLIYTAIEAEITECTDFDGAYNDVKKYYLEMFEDYNNRKISLEDLCKETGISVGDLIVYMDPSSGNIYDNDMQELATMAANESVRIASHLVENNDTYLGSYKCLSDIVDGLFLGTASIDIEILDYLGCHGAGYYSGEDSLTRQFDEILANFNQLKVYNSPDSQYCLVLLKSWIGEDCYNFIEIKWAEIYAKEVR